MSYMINASENFKLCYELLEIIDTQGVVIDKQRELIVKLSTNNLEKENMINALLEDCDALY